MDIQWSYWVIFIEIIIPIWFIESNENNTTLFECEGERNEGCCNGYFRDPEGNNCTKCGSGYYGPNCTLICPYPSYGDGCQRECECDNKTCDFSTGCRIPTTDELTSFPLTLESTNVYTNTTFHTVEFTSSTVSGTTNGTTSLTINGILINFIIIFSGVDIMLIFIYTVIFVIDRQREKSAYQTENRHHILLDTTQCMKMLRLIPLPSNLRRIS